MDNQVKKSIPDKIDLCVSFVLYQTAREEIETAVEQVLANDLAVHVVLIDNTCPPLDLGFIENPNVSVVSANANLGYGRGHNIALAASKGRCRYNLVLNTDLQMEPDVLPGMVAFMDDHPEAGMAAPKVLYPDGSLQRLCRLLPAPFTLIGRRFFAHSQWAKNRNKIYEFHDWNYDSIAEFPFLSGCFMLIRRSVLDQVGHFDERYFLYAEDVDLSRRIHAVARTLYFPRYSIVHEYRSQARPSFKRLRHAAMNLIRYFNKWGWLNDAERDGMNDKALAQFGPKSEKGTS
jgi:GT2 family glycosyltransferase